MTPMDTPLPSTDSELTSPENRVLGAWGAWLNALATNAEAAMAAALAYKQLDDRARDQWLAAVEQDVHGLNVPKVAVFAPLLAVEFDVERRARVLRAMGESDVAPTGSERARGLLGIGKDGLRIGVLIAPLYLDFVQVLACGYRANQGFEWVRHDPILRRDTVPIASQELEGTLLEDVSLRALIDELAYAVIAHKRSGQTLPDALSCFAHLFDANDSRMATWETAR